MLNYGGTIDYFIHSTFNVPTEGEAYKYAAYDGLQRLQRALIVVLARVAAGQRPACQA